MFNFFRKRRIKKYIEEASSYIQRTYILPDQSTEKSSPLSDGVRFSISRKRPNDSESEDKVRYSDRDDGIRYSLSSDQDDDIRYIRLLCSCNLRFCKRRDGRVLAS